MADPRLVLGSRSPRRAELLDAAGFDFRQVDPPYDDPADPASHANAPDDPAELALTLATRKADSLAPLLEADEIGLTADTLCVDAAGGLVGTPANHDEALAILSGFANASHEVITAVALVRPDGQVADGFADTAVVTFEELSVDQLAAYIATDAWRGKAGGYNLTERLEAGWPIIVEGDPDTVVGLPIAVLIDRLVALGIKPHADREPSDRPGPAG
ncbi:MAG: Maf family protein [Planctomycetota bacterium]